MFVIKDRLKNTRLYKIDGEVICDTLVDIASNVYKLSLVRIEFLVSETSLITIMSMEDSEEAPYQFDVAYINENIPFYSHKSNQAHKFILNNRKLFFLKFSKEILLEFIIEYLADDNFNGGYSAKGDLIYNNGDSIFFRSYR